VLRFSPEMLVSVGARGYVQDAGVTLGGGRTLDIFKNDFTIVL
jgi:hypothetical protein